MQWLLLILVQDPSGAPRSLSRMEFIDLAWSSVGRGSKKEYGLLFDSVVVAQEDRGLHLDIDPMKEEGHIGWGGLCSFLLLELSEKVKNSRTSSVPCWKPPRTLTCPHRDPVQKVRKVTGLSETRRRVLRVENMLPILNIWSIAGCYLKYILTVTGWRIPNSADWVEFHIIKHCASKSLKVLEPCSSKRHTSFEINGSGLF